MATLPLRNGGVVRLDAEDAERFGGLGWRQDAQGYVLRSVWIPGPARGQRGYSSRISLHRSILDAPPDLCVDHADGDLLNCTRANLRLCTRAENSRNLHTTRGSSRFRGVTFHKQAGRWQAALMTGGRNYHLGLFEDETAAARAYDTAARHHFGAFASPNFATGVTS